MCTNQAATKKIITGAPPMYLLKIGRRLPTSPNIAPMTNINAKPPTRPLGKVSVK
ncbi:Uncharacterised protein [Vibrio cholerae]|nr:Uncharacterised protein [Vibrio cholerae]